MYRAASGFLNKKIDELFLFVFVNAAFRKGILSNKTHTCCRTRTCPVLLSRAEAQIREEFAFIAQRAEIGRVRGKYWM